MKEYAFVIDKNGRRLSPTDKNNAWRLIRTKKAKCIKYNPFTIKLKKTVELEDIDQSVFEMGIDDGSTNVGLSIVQHCVKDGEITRTKVIRKDTMVQRQDVKHLMDIRRGYRNYRRNHKRSRACRFNNRATSKRKGRIAPTIKQKREAILRVADCYSKYINIHKFSLEDVSIDIRALTEGKKLKDKEYQKSNRLDENLRIAVLKRDGGVCQLCGQKHDNSEVHHITPRRWGGADSIYNLILLCPHCHQLVTGCEEKYADYFYEKINGKNIKTNFAQHVMIGKTYLREQLSLRGELKLTSGGDTANKRNYWNIDKTHTNDAVCIACEDFKPDRLDIKEYTIKPIRHKRKSDTTSMGFQLGDYVELTIRSSKLKKEIKVKGYITAFIKGQYGKQKGKLVNVNITTDDGIIYKRCTLSKCRLIERQKNFLNIYNKLLIIKS